MWINRIETSDKLIYTNIRLKIKLKKYNGVATACLSKCLALRDYLNYPRSEFARESRLKKTIGTHSSANYEVSSCS